MAKVNKITEAKLAPISSSGTSCSVSTNGTKVAAGSKLGYWNIEWGDGRSNYGTSNLPNFLNHTYENYGEYVIKLTIKDTKFREAFFEMGMIIRLVSPNPPDPGTVNALSCSRTDVSNAISIAADGNIVQIPSGTCTWNSRIDFSNKAITIKGAGRGVGGTKIIDGSDHTIPATAGLLQWVTKSTGVHRITAIDFDFQTGDSANPDVNNAVPGIQVYGNSHSFRVDNCHFLVGRESGFFIRNNVWGVLDHNTVENNAFIFAYVFHDTWNDNDNGCTGVVANGCADASFADDAWLGTAKFIYFEDNTFTRNPADTDVFPRYVGDGWAGTRFVWRYNNFTDTIVDMHGTESAARSRGGRAFEFYGNTSHMEYVQSPSTVGMRSGTGVIWDNIATFAYPTHDGFLTRVADLANMRSDPGCAVCGAPWTLCDGTKVFDGNIGPETGYPCLDQPARGKSDLLVPNGATPTSWPNQINEPIYGWKNILQGVNSPIVQLASQIADNRDLYNSSTVQTNPTTPFNGTTGVGFGTLANRPATCAAGVGYFAEDTGTWGSKTGTMYICISANNWQTRYGPDGTNTTGLPYTYPHPLTLL